ncbi:2-dehydropantoate 2-reductase [Flavobacterium sp. I-SCBP12n]|uniref:2-dehydropantoate 2-reductase n=2 Tax=Flavobacterium TaxID=237 RepID=A0A9X1XU80_9FLAO|nr:MULTISPECIES: 2-dehydropantoate 2-reductase [Flavobacterium]MBP4142034.1 2-dehydropantoate 2-reductase [Flavobacterium flabelliforme]MCK8143309.1 2-dehydropantoate 2-reductase [Flavobacterium pygoscelis]
MNKKQIVIIGLGGVGGYFGFKINQANEKIKQHSISFVARCQTYDIVKANGLTLLSPEHSISITKPDAMHQTVFNISKPDLVFICVKEYDLTNICEQLSEVITKNTILIPMMNGADIYDRIREIIPYNIILPSCLYVASHIKEKGIIEHKGKSGKLILGKDPEHISEDIGWVIKLIENSKIDFEFKDNSLLDIWTKFIFIASFGLITAKYNSSIGAVCSIQLQKEAATKIMDEIKSIADRKGIYLLDNIIQKTFEKAATFPPKTPTSLQLDLNSGKGNNELELFAGTIIKYGKELNVKTPFTESIYQEIKAIHDI